MKKFLVALQTGGLMENPGNHFQDYQIIEADNELESRKIYNKKNKCDFFYGKCIGEIVDGKITVPLNLFYNPPKPFNYKEFWGKEK